MIIPNNSITILIKLGVESEETFHYDSSKDKLYIN